MITPVFSVISQIGTPLTTKVFNKSDTDAVLWVKIPEHIAHLTIVRIFHIGAVEIHEVPWIRQHRQSWFKIAASDLDLSEGTHLYRVDMVDMITNFKTHIWFEYTIQSDEPDKPYYYMADAREGDKIEDT